MLEVCAALLVATGCRHRVRPPGARDWTALAAPAATLPLRPIARRLRAPRAAGVAGLLFSALFFASILLLRLHPQKNATASEIRSFYLGNNGRYITLVGYYLAPFAGIAFLWFVAVVRTNIVHRTDRFFESVFLASAFLFVAMVFAASAAAGALGAIVRFGSGRIPSPAAIELAHGLSYAFLYTFAAKMAGVFMMVTSTVGYRTHRFDRWLVYATWALAAFLLISISFYELIVLIFPAWVALLSVLILVEGLPDD
jgi:hypothetical protein